MDEVPRFEETIAAVGRLKAGRAAAPDGIEAELVSALDPINLRALNEFFVCVWTGVESMPEEWKAAYLVPLPKKGDWTLCKRWRGILLASIPGKVFAGINNARLAQYVEDKRILPESQCGFRPGRGTMDMIFSLQLAMEIADYKKHPFHVLFVDLVKAYDSVSRAGLWEVLRRKGIPRKLVRIIQAYYSGKKAQISVEGGLSQDFDLATGLGQGCCLAPLLFNIFLSAVVEAWVSSSVWSVLSVLLYGAEVWTQTYPVRKALEKFHLICLRRISGYGLN